jgi:hypothetical protein
MLGVPFNRVERVVTAVELAYLSLETNEESEVVEDVTPGETREGDPVVIALAGKGAVVIVGIVFGEVEAKEEETETEEREEVERVCEAGGSEEGEWE